MIIMMALGSAVQIRTNLFPENLILTIGMQERVQGIHAQSGIWWCDEDNPSHLKPVEPIQIPEQVCGWYDLDSEVLWPLKPPTGAAPSHQIRRYHFLIHDWKESVYIPTTRSEELIVADHGGVNWTLSFMGIGFDLPGFNPSIGLPDDLDVVEIMTS